MKTGISALAKSGKTMSLLNFFSCSANQNPNSMSCEKEKRTSLEKNHVFVSQFCTGRRLQVAG